ncbi:MAG: hypothetical protein HW416_855 [Chloroflexi bacterium]|nr:hypothetical protein [Chloroflexota bacterium]
MMHRLSLESAAIVAALFAALLVAPDHTVAQQSTITLNPAGAPAGTTVTVSSPLQIGICPMYILELSVMWDEPQQMVGQVQGNPCSGWNGTFTVPRDAAPGVHHLSVSPTPGGTVELGTFIVTQSPAPPPEGTPTPTDQAPQPTIYRVRDSGIRCVTAP